MFSDDEITQFLTKLGYSFESVEIHESSDRESYTFNIIIAYKEKPVIFTRNQALSIYGLHVVFMKELKLKLLEL